MSLINPDWIDPIESTFDLEKPIRQRQGLMMVGNPIAMAAGKPGAPRIQADAMRGSIAGNTLLFGTGGLGVVYDGFESGRFISDAAFRATTDCEIRVRGGFRKINSGGIEALFKVWKNDTVVQNDTTFSFNFISSTPVDITVAAGDLIRVQIGGGEGEPGQARNIRYTVGSQRSVGGI